MDLNSPVAIYIETRGILKWM